MRFVLGFGFGDFGYCLCLLGIVLVLFVLMLCLLFCCLWGLGVVGFGFTPGLALGCLLGRGCYCSCELMGWVVLKCLWFV